MGRGVLPLTILELSDVLGSPRAKLPLPVPLRVGDRVRLSFRLKRNHGGRSEVLEVVGEYRVSGVVQAVDHQFVSVEATGKAPSWRAVRKEPHTDRVLSPARFPPTLL